jgi:hypothetical protein
MLVFSSFWVSGFAAHLGWIGGRPEDWQKWASAFVRYSPHLVQSRWSRQVSNPESLVSEPRGAEQIVHSDFGSNLSILSSAGLFGPFLIEMRF